MNQIATDFGTHKPVSPPPTPLGRRQKAAIIVRMMLADGVQLKLDDLPENLQLDLTREMGRIRLVDRKTLKAVAAEFLREMDTLGMAFQGGLPGALDLLNGALSPASLQRLRERTGVLVTGDPWKRIAEIPVETLAESLAAEGAETAAVILANLPVKLAAATLSALPGEKARRITFAVSRARDIDPDTVRTIGQAFAVQHAVVQVPLFPDTAAARIGAILNSSTTAARDEMLTALEERDADLAAEVRREIFTFKHIPERVSRTDAPAIVRGMEQPLLVQALSAGMEAHSDVVEFLLSAISQRLAAQLREEIEESDPVRGADGEAAMAALVERIRDLEAEGAITLTVPDT
ncbi:MAG: FliG C-terminal domain-containing protein [Qingshengfaniella sp.]